MCAGLSTYTIAQQPRASKIARWASGFWQCFLLNCLVCDEKWKILPANKWKIWICWALVWPHQIHVFSRITRINWHSIQMYDAEPIMWCNFIFIATVSVIREELMDGRCGQGHVLLKAIWHHGKPFSQWQSSFQKKAALPVALKLTTVSRCTRNSTPRTVAPVLCYVKLVTCLSIWLFLFWYGVIAWIPMGPIITTGTLLVKWQFKCLYILIL